VETLGAVFREQREALKTRRLEKKWSPQTPAGLEPAKSKGDNVEEEMLLWFDQASQNA